MYASENHQEQVRADFESALADGKALGHRKTVTFSIVVWGLPGAAPLFGGDGQGKGVCVSTLKDTFLGAS